MITQALRVRRGTKLTVAFKSHGVEWRYAILANAAGP